jgi:hypothetical protein
MKEVVAVVPEVPVTVIVKAPVVAVLLAVSVSTLELVEDVGLNEAVTPLGIPAAVNATLPVNPPMSVTVMVSVPLAPCVTDNEEAEALRLKPVVTLALTVRAMVVLAFVLPETPLMVTVEVPVAAVLLAVKVTTLLPVVGLVPKAAVTPLGRPEADSVTLPLNPFTSVTVVVSVALLPCVTASEEAESESVKLAVPVEPVPTNVVMLCPGSEYVNASFETLTALSAANCLEEEVW